MSLLMYLCMDLLAVGVTIGTFSDYCIWHLAHCLANSKCAANICCMSKGKWQTHQGPEAAGSSVNEVDLKTNPDLAVRHIKRIQ